MAGNAEHKYWAFISYSHQDKIWGDWLHKRLETYRVPRRLVGLPHWSGKIPRRLFPIFRDRDELPSSADLGGVLNEALRQSRYQIVICSPRAAQSRWVNEEIKYFKSLGRENRLLAFIVDGEPRVGSERECFPPALRFKSDANGELTDQRTEIIAADARKGRDERDGAILKLISGLLGVSFDDLKQRERQRQFWRRLQFAAVGVATFAAAFGSWRWFEHYKETQALEAHIEKVYDLGRRELLDHHEARAAVYLNEAYRLGRDTPALRFMLGQAMQAIDPLEDIQINTGGPVRRPAFAPDSKSFITPTETKDGVIAQIWETATGKQLALLKGLPNSPLVTKFFPDGKRVLVSGFMKEDLEETRGTGAFTGIWDTTTGEQVARFDGHTGRFGQPADLQGRWLVTADGTDAPKARVWDLESGQIVRALTGSSRALAASISPDRRYVASGDDKGEVLLWDMQTGSAGQHLKGQMSGHVIGVLFTADGRRVLGFSARGDVRIWSTTTAELQLAYAADSGGFNDVVLSADGTRLVTVGVEGYKVWDIERGILQFSLGDNLTNWASATLNADATVLVTSNDKQSLAELLYVSSRRSLVNLECSGQVEAAIFSPDARRLLLASGSGHVGLWRMPFRAQYQFRHERKDGQFSSLYAVAFDASEGQVLTASNDGSLRVWDAASGALVRRFDGPSPIIDAAYSPDHTRLASLAANGTLQIRDTNSLALVATSILPPAWTTDPLVFSGDSRVLAVLPDFYKPAGKTLNLLSTADGHTLTTLPLGCFPSALTFTLDGSEIITGCIDGTLQVWDVRTGERTRTLDGSRSRIWRLVQSKDGRYLAAASVDDPQVRLWNLASGEPPALFNLPQQQYAEAIAFNDEGRLLALGTNTGKVLIRNLDTGELRVIGAHTKELQGLQFLSNDLLLSYRADNSARLWDPWRGELLGDVAMHDWEVWSAVADRSLARLLTGGIDGTATIWDMRPESRGAPEIAARLRCRSPWQLSDEALAPASAPAECFSGAESTP